MNAALGVIVKSELDPALLRKLLRYDPETGKLFWRAREPSMFRGTARCSAHGECAQWNGQNAGLEAIATVSMSGYLKGCVFGHHLLAHRIIWAIVHGVWPTQIDHINGNRADNRIGNLRQASPQENNKNRKLPSDNTSGRIGVFYYKANNCWRAHIGVAGRRVHLGSYGTKEEAINARISAEIEHGFHPNHGRMS